MRELIRELCALSVFCGLALSVAPEGSVKKAAALCCALVLLLPIVTAVKELDYTAYAPELARYRELGQALTEDAEARAERLNRLVVERECAAWIEQSAAALGAGLRAEVQARWDLGGFWVPEKARLRGVWTEEQRRALSAQIGAELGIGPAQQEWVSDEDGNAAEETGGDQDPAADPGGRAADPADPG